MERKNFNDVLKEKEKREQAAEGDRVPALDDAGWVKVLSPGRLVARRFFRNRLAIAGLAILIAMFAFSFLGPLVYPYSQTEIFYKYDDLTVDYASAAQRTDYASYAAGSADAGKIHYSVKNRLNALIRGMEEKSLAEQAVTADDGTGYSLKKLGENIYGLYSGGEKTVARLIEGAEAAVYNSFTGAFSGEDLTEGFKNAVIAAVAAKAGRFDFGGASYTLEAGKKNVWNVKSAGTIVTYLAGDMPPGFDEAAKGASGGSFTFGGKTYTVKENDDIAAAGEETLALVAATYVFDAYDLSSPISDDFKVQALLATCGGGTFSLEGADYAVAEAGGVMTVTKDGAPYAQLSTLAVRAYTGEDSLDIAFKQQVRDVYAKMAAGNSATASFIAAVPKLGGTGAVVYGPDGKPEYEQSEITITKKVGQYVLTCEQVTYLIDIFAAPTKAHVFGTDGDGMDVLARMMYGGRVSLMVGFVVVALEILLGVLLGGLAGFFGGLADNLIMRLADIFYCIPTLPVMIILGAMLDALKMNAYLRLVWMMAVLGILGWAGVARLVRGQILSLREQEFMTAAEATGIRTVHRIFRHLVPNVLPQLIVYATMNLGGVIIYESTLSYLGLGVKHPLATWGTMINAVAGSSEAMIRYTYIWVPVGCLICLTVIAFNFVGDGLRDAFDPKMKR